MAGNNLQGQTYGEWTVIGPASPDRYGRRQWLCRCSCGKERIVPADNLRSGKSRSCGHKRPIRSNLAGLRFGRLTVLRPDHNRPSLHATLWRCLCDCGKETTVSATNLKSGHTTSCGCVRQEAQQSTAARVEGLKQSPLTGAYETNIRAKRFAISNGQQLWEVRNLSKFVRDHAELLGIEPGDHAAAVRTAKSLFDASYRHCKWHGWSVQRIEDIRQAEEGDDPNAQNKQ